MLLLDSKTGVARLLPTTWQGPQEFNESATIYLANYKFMASGRQMIRFLDFFIIYPAFSSFLLYILWA